MAWQRLVVGSASFLLATWSIEASAEQQVLLKIQPSQGLQCEPAPGGEPLCRFSASANSPPMYNTAYRPQSEWCFDVPANLHCVQLTNERNAVIKSRDDWKSSNTFFVYETKDLYTQTEINGLFDIKVAGVKAELKNLDTKINNDVIEAIKKLPPDLITADMEERVTAKVVADLMPQIKNIFDRMKQEIIDQLGK